MATPDECRRLIMASQTVLQEIQKIRETLETWKIYNPQRFASDDQTESNLSLIVDMAHAITCTKLEGLPSATAQHISEGFSQILNCLTNLPDPGDPADRLRFDVVTTKLAEANMAVNGILERGLNWLGFLAFTRLQQGEQAKVRSALDSALQVASEDGVKIKEILSSAERSLEDASKRSIKIIADAGIIASAKECKKYKVVFRENSERLNVEATAWGFGALVFACTAIMALLLHEIPPDVFKTDSKIAIINYAGNRLFLLGVFVTGIAWCGKMMRAAKHLAAVNIHRSNALESFEAFVAAAEGDDLIKKAIIVEACKTIFGHVPNGYIDQTPSADDGRKDFLDITKHVSDIVKAEKS